MGIEDLRSKLAQHQQEHVLQFWDQLSDQQRQQLKTQISALDLELIDRLVGGQEKQVDFGELAARAEPPPAVNANGSGAGWTVDQARQKASRRCVMGK